MLNEAVTIDATVTPIGRRPRICVAGSGGGHIRQLLDLEPVWSEYDHFIVTEETALTRNLGEKSRIYFVRHFAIGQARLGRPFKMLASGFENFVQTVRILDKERPDVLITTGAGSVFFSVVWARLLGAKIILIESFARYRTLSAFARLTAPFAHIKIVQSPLLKHRLRDSLVFDPTVIIDAERPPKQPLLFATVGATLPFDRLITSVAQVKAQGGITERIVAQTGVGGVVPEGIETFETLPFATVLATLRDADLVVCHGGTGSLITALREGCRVIAMPRSSRLGEHYDDHQLEITRAFAERGLIAVANSPEELADAIQAVRARPPVMATTLPTALITYLRAFLGDWQASHEKRFNHEVFGVKLCTLGRAELVDEVIRWPPMGGVRLLVTMNLDHVVQLRHSRDFRKAYSHAWVVTTDGAPVFAYAIARGVPVRERVTGADLIKDLMRRMPSSRRLFFVVSSIATGERIVEIMGKQGFPIGNIAYISPPFGFELDPEQSSILSSAIRAHGTTDLFFGVGAPKSEIWIDAHRDQLGDLYAYGFGSGLDFLAGLQARAPEVFRHLGLEWLWRLLHNPQRLWRRYLVDSWAFLPAVVQDIRGRAPHGMARIDD